MFLCTYQVLLIFQNIENNMKEKIKIWLVNLLFWVIFKIDKTVILTLFSGKVLDNNDTVENV